MKNKIIIFTLILLALFSIAGVYAGDVNDTLTAIEDGSQLELNDAEDDLKSIGELLGWPYKNTKFANGSQMKVIKVNFDEFMEFMYPNIDLEDDI